MKNCLKLFLFHASTPIEALFTLLFTLPIAILRDCCAASRPEGRVLLPAMTLLLSCGWGPEHHLFKTFL